MQTITFFWPSVIVSIPTQRVANQSVPGRV